MPKTHPVTFIPVLGGGGKCKLFTLTQSHVNVFGKVSVYTIYPY
jgi:hypothetical protein